MSDHHALRERPQARPHALRTALARATQGVLLGLPLVSWAQQPATPQAGTQTVVVTASRVEQAIEQAPVATSVVTKEDLELGNAMTLDQAIEAEAQAQAICMQTQDFRRAYEAFAAKQRPVFEGD